MTQQVQKDQQPQSHSETAFFLLGGLLLAAALPGLAVAGLAVLAGLRGYAAARHRRWWLRLTPEHPSMLWALAAGALTIGACAVWAWNALPAHGPRALLAPALVSLIGGIVAAPGAFILARRRLREQVLKGRALDVLATAQISDAIRRADDELAARSIGISLHEHTVELRVIDPARRLVAPVPIEVGEDIRYGIGILVSEDSLTDFERSAHFTVAGCDLLVVPQVAGQMRALIIAGSGTGKTELIAAFHAVANRVDMTSVLIDLKGQTADAKRFGQDARDQREYLGAAADITVERGGWDMFDCDRNQLLERLMFIAPKTTSTDYYTQQMLRVLDICIDGRGTKAQVRNLDELQQRLADPVAHVGAALARSITTPRSKGASTDADDVAQKVDAMFAPLREYLPKTGYGWSFSKLRPGSATIVPLSPVKASERLLGQLMLRDLRDLLAARAKSGDRSPLSVIIDEFPQMIEAEDDAAAEAAMIFETARTANVGLILAGQTDSGFSLVAEMQKRLLGAGVAIFLGRSALPEGVAEAAGTRWNLEAAGDPFGFAINSARAQQTFQIPPQYVRRMHTGMFWLIHEGAVVRFLALQTR